MVPRARFGANLVHARRRAEISQEELGVRCDLHRTEISLLERGGREPRLGTILKLAKALDVTPDELCAGILWNMKSQKFQVEE
jgi:transcriptional regulator with XRE-family HTH domain